MAEALEKLFLQKINASHSSTPAWKIPWTEEPGGLQSKGSLESDTTEWLHFHFSLSCIGGGNGNPLQCSCLENPRDGGAWWAAVYGVTQSRTQLKRLSSSSSIQCLILFLIFHFSFKWSQQILESDTAHIVFDLPPYFVLDILRM